MKFKKGQRVRATTWDEYNESTGVITRLDTWRGVTGRGRTRYAVEIDSPIRMGSSALFYEEELEVIE